MIQTENTYLNIVVTGAAGGMGEKVCKTLVQQGYKIFALDIVKPSTIHENIIPIICDITDKNSLERAKEEISAFGKLYAIINLAGVFFMDSIACGDEQKLRKSFDVNFFGTYLVNKTLLNLMDNNGKIIVMSSEVARYSPHPFDAYYALPKITLDSYCDAFRRECVFLNIKVIKIQAGSFATNLTKKAAEEFTNLKGKTPEFDDVLNVFDRFVGKELAAGKNTDIIAKKVLQIVKSKNPKICYHINNSFKLGLINALPEKMQDKIYQFAAKIFKTKKP